MIYIYRYTYENLGENSRKDVCLLGHDDCRDSTVKRLFTHCNIPFLSYSVFGVPTGEKTA